MKHIWCIDEDQYTLDEGYVIDNYKDYKCIRVYIEEKINKVLDNYKTENIFDNLDTAKHILKGMIQIQRDKNSKEIERLQKENEILIEKLFNI